MCNRLVPHTAEAIALAIEKTSIKIGYRRDAGYEPCLIEIVRRGGAKWEAMLRQKIDALVQVTQLRRCGGSNNDRCGRCLPESFLPS